MQDKQNYTLFIADLHLCAGNKKIAQIFFDFISNTAIFADALYILGDLFMLWAGDDDHSLFHERIKEAFKSLVASGTPVFLMPGNRDFLLGEDFAKESNCQLLPMMAIIDLYGRKTLLTHGDDLCGKNALHTHFRSLISKSRNRKLFLLLPFFLRKMLAWFVHCLSCFCTVFKSNKSLAAKMRAEAIFAMQKHDVDQIIHGHIHKESIEEITVGGKVLRRIVLGNWDEQSSVLFYRNDGQAKIFN